MVNKKTCLTCKYEPAWSEPVGADPYLRRHGKCKWSGEIPPMPKIYQLTVVGITRYQDDSGVVTNCKTWEAK